jgi:uncharacterized protein (TIGR02391 family)
MSTLTPSKAKAKELLQKSIDAIPELEKLSKGSDQFIRWKRDTEVTIERIFPPDTRHLSDFKSISYIPPPVMFATARRGDPPKPARDTRPSYLYGLKKARAILESMIGEIETFWEDEPASTLAGDDFWDLIHPAITGVAKSRFDAGHYADAVETSLKHVNATVKTKVKKKTGNELDGSSLMNTAFSIKNPIIALDDLSTESGRNSQVGYMQIFAGSITGIRNPKAHEIINIDRTRAIHLLFLASLLMYKVDESV